MPQACEKHLETVNLAEIAVRYLKHNGQIDTLLVAGIDCEPVLVSYSKSSSPLLLVCEHAGREIPQKLKGLGLSDRERGLHIAYDIGAGKVANLLSQKLDCTLVQQRYSRLVIDCNRPLGSVGSIPEISDFTEILANSNLVEEQRQARERAIFDPFAEQCRLQISQPHILFAFSVHSFTPVMSGINRPWDIGFLYRDQSSLGDKLVASAQVLWPDLTVAGNQPYQIEDGADWFIPNCAEPKAVPHSLIEIRNDHLLTEAGCQEWAERLFDLLAKFMEDTNGSNP